jgi:hypothetical protein
MNITYYKQHKKIMHGMLKHETNKDKINRLENNILDCSARIKKMKQERQEKKKRGKK